MKKHKRISKKSKKGQLTLFMLLGIVLIVLFIIFFIVNNQNFLRTFLKQTQHPVSFYMEECVKFILVDGVVILNDQGGFIYDYNPNLTTTERVFAYSIYRNQNTAPSWDFMQNELARYVEENVEACFDDAPFLIERRDDPSAQVVIYPEKIYAKVDFPISAQIADTEYIHSEFATEHVVPLGRMIQLRDDVIEDMIEYPNLMLLDKLYETDFEMIINPYSGRIKVIEMINASHRLRNNPLSFTFAVYEDHSLPTPLFFTEMIPDVVVEVGVPVVMQARCNKNCRFYDNTILFDIDEYTGVINYLPDRLDVGDYNITLTITDDTYTVSDSFRMVVMP